MDRPHHLPRVLSRADALRLGYTRSAIEHRLRTRDWHVVLPHTYLTRDTLLWEDRLAAAVCYAGDGAVLSGAAALADLGRRACSSWRHARRRRRAVPSSGSGEPPGCRSRRPCPDHRAPMRRGPSRTSPWR
jgi:hypothetical protein